jgi:predicted DsbA family dithiol-disulfide isomerase
MEPVEVLHFTDPGCPWAYSAEPFFTTLRWRYGDGLRWRRILIGLSETAAGYDARGYEPARSARGRTRYARRFGMPFRFEARPRNQGTGLACRAVKAAELQGDAAAEGLLRALRFGFFATNQLMDTEDGIRAQAALVDGLDADRLLADLRSETVDDAYQADRAEARSAELIGVPAIAQDKTANTDGAVRFTAPSLLFRRNGQALVAGGWQSLEAYDTCVVNLAPDLERRALPTPADLLSAFPYGLTTQEVAVACTDPLGEVDREGTARDLIQLAFDGRARRIDVGDDALWKAVSSSA